MQQLIEHLTCQYHISEEAAKNIITDVSSYAEENAPSLGNTLSYLFSFENNSTTD